MGMSEEQWGLARPFYDQLFSTEGLDRINTATNQGFDAFTGLFGTVTDSPYQRAMDSMGITAADTATDIMSGDFELPPWMQEASDDRWDTAVEGMTRGGIDPWRSTAGAQQRQRFNVGEGQIKTDYGLSMLGQAGPLANNTRRTQLAGYNTLFNSGNSLLSPMYGAAGGLAAGASGNISGAANTALNLINSNRQKNANKDPKDGTGDWDAIWQAINEGYTTISNGNFDWGL